MAPEKQVTRTVRKADSKTYQKAFKFFGFCDVNPVVFLHHLNVLDFLVKPVTTIAAGTSETL